MIHTRSPRQAAIAEQMALLCLNAPLTDGQFKLPSSMHLGAQIANDHPIMEMRRQSDARANSGRWMMTASPPAGLGNPKAFLAPLDRFKFSLGSGRRALVMTWCLLPP
jgi:hypothetical protein